MGDFEKEGEKSCIYQGHTNEGIQKYIHSLISENCSNCTKDEKNSNCPKHYFVLDNKKEEIFSEIIKFNLKYFNGKPPIYSHQNPEA
jgi:hypothetical protein